MCQTRTIWVKRHKSDLKRVSHEIREDREQKQGAAVRKGDKRSTPVEKEVIDAFNHDEKKRVQGRQKRDGRSFSKRCQRGV